MDYAKLTAPCGRDCFNCPFNLAIDNIELRETLSQKRGIPEDDVGCKGCREIEGKCKVLGYLGFADQCKIYDCFKSKNIEYCYECDNFPCDLLQPLADGAGQFPHNMKVFNLCRIAKIGVENWAREEAKKSFERYYTGKLDSCVGKKA